MKIANMNDIEALGFPSGRRTKVIVGAQSELQADHFVMGRVEIDSGGKVPLHGHEQEEVYYILSGEGRIQVGEETSIVSAGNVVYIPPFTKHELINTGEELMIMIFVYSPAGIVSHWEEEKQGKLS